MIQADLIAGRERSLEEVAVEAAQVWEPVSAALAARKLKPAT